MRCNRCRASSRATKTPKLRLTCATMQLRTSASVRPPMVGVTDGTKVDRREAARFGKSMEQRQQQEEKLQQQEEKQQ